MSRRINCRRGAIEFISDAAGGTSHFIYNEFYKSEEEYVFAIADAMSAEYRTIVDAGFVLQIDDPGMATSWDMMNPPLSPLNQGESL